MNKIYPPFLALANIAIFYFSNFFISSFEFFGQTVLAAIIGLEGVIIIILSIRLFKKGNTTVNPFKLDETSSLITEGVYRFTRNPMYLGLSSIQLGAAIYFGSYISLILIPVFIVYITKKQIYFEEISLEKKFGQDFLKYSDKVRRWI